MKNHTTALEILSNGFKENFLNIVTDKTGKFVNNGPAELLVNFIRRKSSDDGRSFIETAEKFSNRPDYGQDGEVGGVNVDHQTGVTYVGAEGDSTWMTLGLLVTETMEGGGIPGWWDHQWSTGH